MRKTPLALGIILVFTGVLVSSISTSPTEKSKELVVQPQEKQWNITGYFYVNEKLIVDLGVPTAEFIPDGKVNFTVTIGDPTGETSVFLLTYYHEYQIFTKYILESSSNALYVDEPPTFVGGIVQSEGNYTAQVDTNEASWLYPDAPQLGLKKEILERSYPYRNFLPLGVVLIIGGTFLSIWATRFSKSTRRARRDVR